MRFLNLGLNDKAPDAKTIWKFRNDLATGSVARILFKLFDERLRAEGLITHNGTIVDATFVEAPRQRNTPEENELIKKGTRLLNGKKKSKSIRLPKRIRTLVGLAKETSVISDIRIMSKQTPIVS